MRKPNDPGIVPCNHIIIYIIIIIVMENTHPLC